MKKQSFDRSCLRCGAEEVIPKASILDRGAANYPLFSLTVQVEKHPEAVLFKGSKAETLYARLCGRCGHAELYVENHEELYEAYRQANKRE